jgi:hypothetical protein
MAAAEVDHVPGSGRAAAGKSKDKDMRSILLHFESGSTRIDGFACSACDWFHLFTSAEPDGTLPREEVELAHARFEAHKCAEFPKVQLQDNVPASLKWLRR